MRVFGKKKIILKNFSNFFVNLSGVLKKLKHIVIVDCCRDCGEGKND